MIKLSWIAEIASSHSTNVRNSKFSCLLKSYEYHGFITEQMSETETSVHWEGTCTKHFNPEPLSTHQCYPAGTKLSSNIYFS